MTRSLFATAMGAWVFAAATSVAPPMSARSAQGIALPDGPGKAEFLATCDGCHGTDMIVGTRRSEADWKGVVESMVGQGATGTPEQFSAAVRYLATNFGTAPPPPPAAAARQAPQAPGGGPGRNLQQPDPWVGKKKLLLIADVQSGFHHDSISHAAAVIERIGRESGAYMTMIRTDSQLITKQPILGRGSRYGGRPVNARNLDYFDAIFFLGSGEGTLSPQQKADLLAFVRDDGKGFIGGHAATIGFYDWPEFGDLIGGFMDSEYPVSGMPVVTEDMSFPGAAAFGKAFFYPDQFPVLKAPYEKGKVHTIMRLDTSKMDEAQKARRPDGDLPIVWTKSYGKGRVFNSSFGHPEASWDDPKVQQLYLEGIKWAIGGTPAQK